MHAYLQGDTDIVVGGQVPLGHFIREGNRALDELGCRPARQHPSCQGFEVSWVEEGSRLKEDIQTRLRPIYLCVYMYTCVRVRAGERARVRACICVCVRTHSLSCPSLKSCSKAYAQKWHSALTRARALYLLSLWRESGCSVAQPEPLKVKCAPDNKLLA